jgi:DNA processing protein
MRDLAGYDVCIVSGLALGIDSVAHRCALDAGLKTLAVLGSGLDDRVIYPRTNLALAHRILEEGGGLLSEMPADHSPRPYDFPRRNRIIAGLSDATLIVEATKRSGTLVTARLAMEYNREVLALPGSILMPTSEGPHELIRNGATPATCIKDILEALDMEYTDDTTSTHAPSVHDLTEIERAVWKHLSEPITKDELYANAHLSITDFNMALSTLELKGYIQQRLGHIERVC